MPKEAKMEKIKKFIDYNRFLVIGPIVGILIWFYAVSCTPATSDPLDPNVQVTAVGLKQSFATWESEQQRISKLFEIAAEDLERQRENNKRIEEMIVKIATGGAADLPGLIQLIIGGGGLGALLDNIRKRGIIAGLKRNQE